MPARPAADAPPENLRTARIIAVIAGLCVLALLFAAYSARAQPPQLLPAPQSRLETTEPGQTQASVVLAGGCFWGVQAVFQHTRGVLNAVSGYAGGNASDATYEAVSTGGTGHAEAVKISYDPSVISLGELLQVFFSVAHDPTQLDRQYPDTGTQYRSAIFYKDAAQKALAERYIAQLDAAKVFPHKIVTELAAEKSFFPAEQYHQNYATLHPTDGYISRFDLPKIANLKATLPALYREQVSLVAN